MKAETVEMIEAMDPPFHAHEGDRSVCTYPRCGVRADRAIHSRAVAGSIGARYVEPESALTA